MNLPLRLWKRFTGQYDKTEYMIFTEHGIILGPCWPNAGTFHVMKTGKVINGTEVIAIKECTEFDKNNIAKDHG